MMIGIPGKKENLTPYRACIGCGEVIALNYILKAAGKNAIIVGTTGCAEVFSTPYPKTAWTVPYIHVAFENAAAVASGVESALKYLKKKMNIIAIAGDGGTYDIGFQSLSGAIERGHKFCYICLDNQAYMNTGIQRSGATPQYAFTTTTPAGKLELRKPLPEIIAAHRNVYVATANVAFSEDLVKKIIKGLKFNGPSYIQIFSPCVPGWKYPSGDSIKIARLAVETNFSPLYEIENNRYKINYKPEKRKPVEEFLRLQGRFKHLFTDKNKDLIKKMQEHIDQEWNNLLRLCGKV